MCSYHRCLSKWLLVTLSSDFPGHHEEVPQPIERALPLEEQYKLVPGRVSCSGGRNLAFTGLMKLSLQKLYLDAEQSNMPPRFLHTATKAEIARWVACKNEVVLWGVQNRINFLQRNADCDELRRENKQKRRFARGKCACAYCQGEFGNDKLSQDTCIVLYFWSMGISIDEGFAEIDDVTKKITTTPVEEVVKEAEEKGINVREMDWLYLELELRKRLQVDDDDMSRAEMARLAKEKGLKKITTMDWFEVQWKIIHLGKTNGDGEGKGKKLLTKAEAEKKAFGLFRPVCHFFDHLSSIMLTYTRIRISQFAPN
jgi:hypothetical protein